MLTIITRATSKRLTTIEAVKTELEIADATQDAFLASLIDQASDAIASWCGRDFARETVREIIFMDVAHGSMILTRRPVLSIEALQMGSLTLSPTQAMVDESGLLYRVEANGRRIPWLPGRYTIDYVTGFVMPGETDRTLPADIERAAIIMVKSMWMGRNRDPLIKLEDISGIARFTYETDGSCSGLTADVLALLSGHGEAVFR